jgi:hypothetical protein
LETKLPVPTVRHYEVYVNKFGTDTPGNFIGIVDVLSESDDVVINSWCLKNLGPRWKVHNNNLIMNWNYMKIDDIMDYKVITTIQRK